MNDDDNFVANRTPTIVNLVFQDIDTLDDESSRVIYTLNKQMISLLHITSTFWHTFSVLLRPIIPSKDEADDDKGSLNAV